MFLTGLDVDAATVAPEIENEGRSLKGGIFRASCSREPRVVGKGGKEINLRQRAMMISDEEPITEPSVGPAPCRPIHLQLGSVSLRRRLSVGWSMYPDSDPLRRWCEQIRERYYIPEWLLKRWTMSIRWD
jgi:hypothetical protein